jgi:hypothetical protein
LGGSRMADSGALNQLILLREVRSYGVGAPQGFPMSIAYILRRCMHAWERGSLARWGCARLRVGITNGTTSAGRRSSEMVDAERIPGIAVVFVYLRVTIS